VSLRFIMINSKIISSQKDTRLLVLKIFNQIISQKETRHLTHFMAGLGSVMLQINFLHPLRRFPVLVMIYVFQTAQLQDVLSLLIVVLAVI